MYPLDMVGQSNGEKAVFSTDSSATTGREHAKKKMNLDTDIILFKNTNSK